MFRTGRSLELSLASNLAEELERQRRADLAAIGNPLKRAIGLALHKLTVTRPAVAEAALQLEARSAGYSYLGYGAQSSIYRQGDYVIKVDRASASLSDTGRAAKALELRERYALVSRFLQPFLLQNEVVTIAEHPLGKARNVQIIQPFYSFRQDVEFFTTGNGQVDPERLDQIRRRYPGIESALGEFISRSFHMRASTGYWPDTNGTNNLVLHQDGQDLRLIDSQPVGQEHTGVQLLIREQISSLQEALLATN